MTQKLQAADQMIEQMLHRFLELLFKAPFEPWQHIGQEFLSVILAYTILLAYGKMLSAIFAGILRALKFALSFAKKAWDFLWIEGTATP